MFLVLGDQLFYDDENILSSDKVLMIESKSLFERFKYHKAKIAYIITCMREYRDYLKSKNIKIEYHQIDEDSSFEKTLSEINSKITLYEPSDKSFRNSLYNYFNKFCIGYEVLNNPNFLTDSNHSNEFLDNLGGKKLKMHDFYKFQRNRLGILMDGKKPLGGKYSFDEDNRKKIPKDHTVNNNVIKFSTKNWNEVVEYVNKAFSKNHGEISSESIFPLNFRQAKKALKNFFDYRLELFGDYEDALSDKDNILYHSALSPCINNGILNPSEILIELDKYLTKNFNFSIFKGGNDIPKNINSIEGYIRQIIGWREWMKLTSEYVYDKDFKNYNFFNNKNKLPEYFWNLSDLEKNKDKIPYPIYKSLLNLKNSGYNHHIERLMVFSNYMTLLKTDPMEMYNWFMSMYLDAYQWVMVPNVFGMGSFADGGIYATKPYVAGGNYIKKMSDYKNSKEWSDGITDKFWDFLMTNESYFEQNYRMKMLITSRKKKMSGN